jgi:hypothetical protein
MSLAIIIPSKTVSNVVPCVEAIHAFDPGHHTVIVDDGLQLNPWPFLLDGTTIIKGEQPFIFSRNINAGVRAAIQRDPSVEGFVFCNDDCLLRSAEGFQILYESWKANPEFGCIGAVTNLTGQPLQWPKGVGLREVPHIAYVCVFVPRTTLEQVQWMDERYCLDYGVDDRDHCEAIVRAGLKVGVHDGCFVDHGSLVSTFRGEPTKPRSFAQNYELFKRKWGIM